MNKQVEQIRAEIEQRKGCFVRIDDCKEKYLTEAEKLSVVVKWNEYIEEQYDSLLAFIDSLPEEKPSKDLEEAAEEYSRGLDYYHYTGDDPAIAFIAGAQWQKEQMPMPEDTVIFQKGVAEGKRLMLEDAVELGTTDIYWEQDGDRAFPTFDPPVEDLLMPGIISQRFEDGDKVKIIIVKEDEK